MSIHSIVVSNITDFQTLTTILQESGIRFTPTQAHDKRTKVNCLHAIEAVIGQDTVLITQQGPKDAFQFQSSGRSFREKKGIEQIATKDPEVVRRERELREKQRRVEEEQRRAEEQRQRELQKRQVEDRRRQEEEARLRREVEGKTELGREAARIRSKLAASSPSAGLSTPAEPAIPADQDSLERISRAIGRLHQENARRKILQQVDEMAAKFGLSLDGQETLEDQTIELRFRG